eukprot:TRINITY_DN569_c0_g1_i1.p1 TRINITY_DN569_c0_g1~~TRINITY_DN569_c0_g1_i1.p1  ORF type:complete len:210 (+),score=12.30 TRINITY_DN569_c0_g1_i1:143-772(+)
MAPVAVLLLLTFLQLAVHGYAVSPPADSVSIASVNWNGDGCLPDTATATISDDGKALTVIYSNFRAVTDAGLPGRRKYCIVSVELKYPKGFSFSLFEITMRGYAKLDEAVTGTVSTRYYFSGQQGSSHSTKHFVGGANGFDDNFEVSDAFVNPQFVGCNTVRNLNINTEVRVKPGNFQPPRQGLVTLDSTDMKVSQLFYLSWKECPAAR